MENDGWADYGGGRYYSPTMGRFLSLQGPLSSSGGYSSSGAAGVAAALGAEPASGSGFNWTGIHPEIPGYAAAGAAAGYLVGAWIGAETGGDIGGPPGWVVGGVLGALGGFLSDLFGGGGPERPSGPIWWKETHQGGDPQEWARKNGIYPAWVASMHPLAGVLPVAQMQGGPQRPLAKTPQACQQAALKKLHECRIHLLIEAAHLIGGTTGACYWAAAGATALGPEGPPVGGLACSLVANAPAAIGFVLWGRGCSQQYQQDMQRCGR